MSVPARVAAGASAAPDAGRSDAIRGLHQEEARDCQWEAGRDFPWVMGGLVRPVLPQHWDELESRLTQRLPGERLRAVCWKGPLAAQAPRVVPPRASLVLQPVPDGELA
jgi:hypothetical protein